MMSGVSSFICIPSSVTVCKNVQKQPQNLNRRAETGERSTMFGREAVVMEERHKATQLREAGRLITGYKRYSNNHDKLLDGRF